MVIVSHLFFTILTFAFPVLFFSSFHLFIFSSFYLFIFCIRTYEPISDLGPVPSWGILALGPSGTVVTLKIMSPTAAAAQHRSTGQKAKEDSWNLPLKMGGLWTSNSSAGEPLLLLLLLYYFIC